MSTLGYTQETFNKEAKGNLADTYNHARNWETKEGTVNDLANDLLSTLCTFRLGIKEGSNKKASCSEVWGVAIDLDLKPHIDTKTKEKIAGCSVARTKAYLESNNLNYIFYLSSSGTKGEDCTPHRAVVFFSQALPVEKAECFSKFLSLELQGKEICFDSTRLWFFTVPENLDTLSFNSNGQYIDLVINPEIQKLNSDITEKKTKRLKSLITNSNEIDEPLIQKLNKGLTAYALSVGLQSFHESIGIQTKINASRRGLEDRSDANLPPLVERFDVQPPGSDTFDRVDANLTEDGMLLFYDRRDGKAGFTGTFLQWLIKCELGGSYEPSLDEQLNKARVLFELFNLEWPLEYPKSASVFWQSYLKENAKSLMYITKSASWCLYNGKHWVKLLKDDQINHVADWSLKYYGRVSSSHLSTIRTTLKNVTCLADQKWGMKIYPRPPRDREWFGFNDGLFNTITKEFVPHTSDVFTWSCQAYNWNDYQDTEKGRAVRDALMEIISYIVVGDERKYQAYLNALILYCNSQLHKANIAIWQYGDGGAGKSTMQDYTVKMLGHSALGGRVVDVKSKMLFDSQHSMGMLLDGTNLSFSEFVMPRDKDCSILKDIIAPDGDNGKSDIGESLGCAIHVDNKYQQPYTDFGYFDCIISSQKKSNIVDISDSGWARRFFYVNFKKVEKAEKELPFAFVNQNLRYLFVYFLQQDTEYILEQFLDYVNDTKTEEIKTLQVENNVAAQYLVEHLEESEELLPVAQIWADFQRRKEDYGVSPSLKTFRTYLESALKAFGSSDKHKMIHTQGRHLYVYYQLYSPISESSNGNGSANGNGNGHKKLDDFSFTS